MSRPDSPGLLLIAISLLGACAEEPGARPDARPDRPAASELPLSLEGGPPGLEALGSCQPLPAGCACPQACQAGSCDNSRCPCQAVPGVSYTTLAPSNPYPGNVSQHGDVNLLLRQWRSVEAARALVEISGPTDSKPPPQLYSLFTDDRVPVFAATYQLQGWDWGCNCPGGYLQQPEVTLAGMSTTPGEIIQAPFSGYDLGSGHTALLLYAAAGTLTLKYTVEDDVVKGYTVHLDGICVEPSLQKLYDDCNAAGRKQLPALKGKQPLGRARGPELRAAIRDTGSWMDPRARKDWWQGK